MCCFPFSLLFLEIVKRFVFGWKMAPFQLNYWSGVLTRALLEYAAPYQLNLPEHFPNWVYANNIVNFLFLFYVKIASIHHVFQVLFNHALFLEIFAEFAAFYFRCYMYIYVYIYIYIYILIYLGLLCVLLLFLIFCYYKHKNITGCFAILYKQ